MERERIGTASKIERKGFKKEKDPCSSRQGGREEN